MLNTETSFWHPYADMGSVRHSELVIDRAEDVWVWDTDGNRYLDATGGLWYANVGHGRPEIRAAVAAQMERLAGYYTFFDLANRPVLELAEALAERAPMPAKVFFASGGSDGIDTAAKLARRYWWEVGEPDRNVLISRTAGYHGTHGFGTALGGIPSNRQGFGPQNETIQVRHDSLEELEQTFARVGPERVAAVFVEPVIGAGGVYPPAPGYIEGVADLCKRTGALLVVDAVICAFGRLGTWFGIERWKRGALHDRVREGRDERLSPARRCHGLRADRRAVLARAGGADLQARRDVRRPPHVLRRRAREHRPAGARRPDRARTRTGAGAARCPGAAC